MAWTINSYEPSKNADYYRAVIAGISDATDLTNQIIVDVSADTTGPWTQAMIQGVEWSVTDGGCIHIGFYATACEYVLNLAGNGRMVWDASAGIVDPQATGYTGDIVLSTIGLNTTGYGFTLKLLLMKAA